MDQPQIIGLDQQLGPHQENQIIAASGSHRVDNDLERFELR
jgi:hypothetical protein